MPSASSVVNAEAVIQVGDLISFGTFPRKRDKRSSRSRIILDELRIYAPCIEKCVEDWGLSERQKTDDPTIHAQIWNASLTILECLQTFISSGGFWQGRWPVFEVSQKGTCFPKECARHVYFFLGDILRHEFHPHILAGYKRANREGAHLLIDWGPRDYDTFGELLDFAGAVLDEIGLQKKYGLNAASAYEIK